MRIVKIPVDHPNCDDCVCNPCIGNSCGIYTDGEACLRLVEVSDADALATNKEILTDYSDLADCLTQTGWTKEERD